MRSPAKKGESGRSDEPGGVIRYIGGVLSEAAFLTRRMLRAISRIGEQGPTPPPLPPPPRPSSMVQDGGGPISVPNPVVFDARFPILQDRPDPGRITPMGLRGMLEEMDLQDRQSVVQTAGAIQATGAVLFHDTSPPVAEPSARRLQMLQHMVPPGGGPTFGRPANLPPIDPATGNPIDPPKPKPQVRRDPKPPTPRDWEW